MADVWIISLELRMFNLVKDQDPPTFFLRNYSMQPHVGSSKMSYRSIFQ